MYEFKCEHGLNKKWYELESPKSEANKKCAETLAELQFS